jgi:hypothetical protein
MNVYDWLSGLRHIILQNSPNFLANNAGAIFKVNVTHVHEVLGRGEGDEESVSSAI